MSKPFLSEFKEDTSGGVKLAPDPGGWHADHRLLRGLSKGTPLHGVSSFCSISSVPGIWAHAETFYDLWAATEDIESDREDLRKEALASWRGLLTLVGLREASRLRVLLQPLTANMNKPFLRAALSTLPPRLLAQPADRERSRQVDFRQPSSGLGFILYEDPLDGHVSIAGLLLPALLVLPAREFRFASYAAIPWAMDVGKASRFPLGDPTLPNCLRPRQANALRLFLESLLANVELHERETTGLTRNPYSLLRDRVSAFHRDVLALTTGQQSHFEMTTLPFTPGDALTQVPLSFLMTVPSHVNREGDSGQVVTDCELPLRRLKVLEDFRAVFFSNRLRLDPLDGDGVERAVWGDLYFDDAFESIVAERLDASGAAAKGVFAVTPDDLFEDHLIPVDFQIGQNKAYEPHKALMHYLLPLTPAALLFFSPEELAERLSVSEAEDGKGGITVALRLTLKDRAGRPWDFRLERTYETAEIVKGGRGVTPPDLAIWPGRYADDWQHYFVYVLGGNILGTEELTFRLKQPIGRSQLRAMAGSGSQRLGRLAAILDDEPVSKATFDEASLGGRSPQESVFQIDAAPEALCCSFEAAEGLLLLALPAAPAVQEPDSWWAAIDFGATNTSIAVVRNPRPPIRPRALDFENRTLLPFVVSAQKEWNQVGGETQDLGMATQDERARLSAVVNARHQFIPPDRVTPPFLTLLRKRPVQSEGKAPAIGEHLVAYAEGPEWFGEVVAYEDRYKSGLKWDKGTETLIEAFVRQLVLQLCFEARMSGVAPGAISWRFSVPSSLPPGRLEGYRGLVKKVLAETLGLDTDKLIVDFPLESSSAFSYMVNFTNNSQGSLPVVLDTGGHSTDIALHLPGLPQPLWEGSLELGGQHILVDDWIDRNAGDDDATRQKWWPVAAKLVEALCGLAADDHDEAEALGENGRRIAVEMAINTKGLPSVEEAHDLAGDPGAELVRRTLRRADFALFGVVEYLRILFDSGVLHSDDLAGDLGLYLCGRGGKLIGAALKASDQVAVAESDSLTRLRQFWDSGSQTADQRDLGFAGHAPSGHPKLEVALGAAAMLDVRPIDHVIDGHPLPMGGGLRLRRRGEDKVVVGEPWEIDAHSALPLRELSGPDGRSFSFDLEDTSAFTNFMARYEASLGLGGSRIKEDYLNSVMAQLRLRMFHLFEEARVADRPEGFLQPVFAMSLRATLERWDDVFV
ncbi:MAG: hypothetical protein Kilf2KO_20470 [Rhodospirillales bacterium]